MNLPKSQSGFAHLLLILILAILLGITFYLLKDRLVLMVDSILNKPQVKGIQNTPFVSSYGTKLYLNGEEYQFTGVNAYELATLPGVTAGCGGTIPSLDSFFSSLRPGSMVRFWAFQGASAT